jgi:two-component system nitrogen regulation sensor histidine kinase NtrY
LNNKPGLNYQGPKKTPYQTRQKWLIAAIASPGLLISIVFILSTDQSLQFRILSVIILLALCFIFVALLLRESTNMMLTVSNLAGSIADGEYSMRGQVIDKNDKLCQVFEALNQLADELKNQKYSEIEHTGLIENILQSIDIAVFAFDDSGRLTMANSAADKLYNVEKLMEKGLTSHSLDLTPFIENMPKGIIDRQFPGQNGYWQMQLNRFRQDGEARDLLLISNVSKAFKEQERDSWQRILRVLGHELNNSLTPIRSMSESLLTLISSKNKPDDWQEDVESGINLINKRTHAISRFMQDFSKLAKLPTPSTRLTDFKGIIERCCQLLGESNFNLQSGDSVEIIADADQLEQLLINILKNGIEASPEGEKVAVSWFTQNESLICEITDNGSGIANFDNLFVPFFSTKQTGSGIGLVLSRQIAEAHDGSFDLSNRSDGSGCVARLVLPL